MTVDTQSNNPKGNVTEVMRRLWEEITGVSDIHDDTSFFSIGGDSFSAVQLMTRVRQQFGVHLKVASLYENPKLGQLAQAIRDVSHKAADERIVRFREGTGEVAIVLVHPGGGGLAIYQDLVEGIMPGVACYGIQGYSADRGRLAALHDTVEALADDYLDALQVSIPEKGILLAGYCFGGLIAYEMARRCDSREFSCLDLVLVDSAHPGLRHDDPSSRAQRLYAIFGHVLDMSPKEFSELPEDDRIECILGGARSRALVPNGVTDDNARGYIALAENHMSLELDYRPGSLARRPLLIRATRDNRFNGRSLSLGWATYGGVVPRAAIVEGDHESIIRRPAASEIATIINRLLEDVHRLPDEPILSVQGR